MYDLFENVCKLNCKNGMTSYSPIYMIKMRRIKILNLTFRNLKLPFSPL